MGLQFSNFFCEQTVTNTGSHYNDILKRLKMIMMDQNDKTHVNIDYNQCQIILNDFIYLLTNHDDAFHDIYHELGGECDFKRCERLWRNQRNRTNEKEKERKENCIDYNEIMEQLIDRIHSHYTHSYDRGLRLNRQEADTINNAIYNHNNINDEKCSFNDQILNTIHNIIHSKHIQFTQLKNKKIENNQISSKFISLHHHFDNIYDPGYAFEFHYGAPPKHCNNIEFMKPKHKSFKTELLSNKYAILTITQFNKELKKAQLHFTSKYYSIYTQLIESQMDDFDRSLLLEVHGPMNVNHILAMMIYCNYDLIPYEFSKTYRKIHANESTQSIKTRHAEFYYLGKYLNGIANTYGQEVGKNDIDIFYHGMTQKLMFPYIDAKATVWGPFSTTSSEPVALNFVQRHGMLLKLRGADYMKYFSCSWLSDFSNEKEYFFVRSCYNFKQLIDISIPEFAVHFDCIIEAINLFEAMNINSESITNSMQQLMILLVEDKLGIKTFETLHEYGRKLFDYYLEHKKIYLGIDFNSLKNNYSFLYPLFTLNDQKEDILNVSVFLDLYCNVQWIDISGIRLTNHLQNNIIKCIRNYSKLNEISIKKYRWNQKDIQTFVDLMQPELKRLNWKIEVCEELTIKIKKTQSFE
eukprot:336929_1